MLGSKTIGRSVVFGLGYLAGTRAGRARYDQIQQAGIALLGQIRSQLDAAPQNSPAAKTGALVGAARRAWDDSDITLGRR